MVAKQISGSGMAPDGSQYVTITDGGGNLIAGSTGSAATVSAPSDAFNNSTNAQTNIAENMVFNGTTWDRQRSLTVGATLQTTATGIPAMVQLPQSSIAAGIPMSASTATVDNRVLKASAGNLYSFTCSAGASAGFLMVFNATSAPIDGAVTPAYVEPVAANATITRSFTYPIYCSTGVTLVFSTTGPFTKTASATAFLAGQAV